MNIILVLLVLLFAAPAWAQPVPPAQPALCAHPPCPTSEGGSVGGLIPAGSFGQIQTNAGSVLGIYGGAACSGGSAIASLDSSGAVTCVAAGGSVAGVSSLNGLTGALFIVGTTNQIAVTPLGTSVTLSTPQAIGTTSAPTFAGLTLSGLGSGGTTCVQAAASGQLSSTGAPCGSGSAGVTSITGTANEIIASQSTGAVTLSTPQAIAPASSPTFTGLTLSSLGGAGTVCLQVGNTGIVSTTGAPCGSGGAGGISSLNSQVGASQTFGNDTNVTISSATNVHTLGWTGTLARARGGTGIGTGLTGLILSSGTSPFSAYAGTSCPGAAVQSLDASGSATCVSLTLTAVTSLAGLTGALNMVGTANEISVVPSGQTITLMTPQAIAPSSSPTFNGLSITPCSLAGATGVVIHDAATIGCAPQLGVARGGTGSTSLPVALLLGNTVSPINGYTGTSCPGQAITALSAAGVASCIAPSGGVTSLTGTANQVNVSQPTGAVVLSLPQNIHTGASPTFNNLTLTAAVGTILQLNSQQCLGQSNGAVVHSLGSVFCVPQLGVSRGGTGATSLPSTLLRGNGASPISAYGGTVCPVGQVMTGLSSLGVATCTPPGGFNGTTNMMTSTFSACTMTFNGGILVSTTC